MLKIHYDISADRVLDDKIFTHDSKVMHKAHVEKIYLFGYFYGTWETSAEKIYKASKILGAEGFETEVINVPFGHGGNALNPNDPNISLTNGKGWRLRKDWEGNICPTTTCPDEKCISDTLKVNNQLAEMGFQELFLDDDCRFGMWGPNLQGCFCDECIKRFSEKIGKNISPTEIVMGSHEIKEAWMDFQSDNLVNYLVKTKPKNLRLGVMIMHNGDRRHGIDIIKMRKAIPDIFFRIGEAHFSDSSMERKTSKIEITTSIHTHMALAGGGKNCWSESTVFPIGQLSPANWVKKINWEIEAGLRNIYLMSGTGFLTDDYWEALAKAYPELLEISRQPEPKHDVREFVWGL